MRRRIKLQKGQLIEIPEGEGYTFWRRFLALLSDREADHADWVILIDKDLEKIVETELHETLEEGCKALEQEIETVMYQQHGRLHRRGWGSWSRLQPKWFDVVRRLGYELLDKRIMQGVWLTNWNKRPGSYHEQYGNVPDGSYVRKGEFLKQIVQIGGRTKTVVMKTSRFMGLYEPHEVEGTDLIRIENENRWRGVMSSGPFQSWLREADDEEIALLYREFPSCREVQRELIRRSQDFHVSEELKPKLKWSKIGKIKNAEMRRTLMTVGIVSDYPEPVAVDDEGELYELDKQTRVLKLTCPSTGRIYHLGVPARMRTPREARRWTLGLPEGAEILMET